MKSGQILILLSFFLIVASTAILPARTWTEAGTGRKLEGEFVKLDADKNVVIKRADGRVVKVPIARLSEADQTFAKTRVKAGTLPRKEQAATDARVLVRSVTFADDSKWPPQE